MNDHDEAQLFSDDGETDAVYQQYLIDSMKSRKASKSVGQIAYETWRSLVIPPFLCPWEYLPISSQAAWEDISQAVLDHDTECDEYLRAQEGRY